MCFLRIFCKFALHTFYSEKMLFQYDILMQSIDKLLLAALIQDSAVKSAFEMAVSWYCWVTVISLVTNFHGCLCWPTLQPPVRPVTSKQNELDSDESRKVLGSSVVTSVSVIMDHGNGTKTFLTDGVENPELKTNVIGSPGNLLSPDRYEFYTFDETGDLVKRLMTWDEIQALIAGSDSNAFLGDASIPMYYSDAIPDKLGSTHLTANDFQTSDIQGVHKVVESVQNVLKSELAASQSKIPPVAKPGFMSNSLNWSLFLPTLLDNAEEGSEINNLGVLISPSALSSSTDRNILKHSTSMQTNATQTAEIEVQNVTESDKSTTLDTTFSTHKEFSKKTEKPSRYKPTTNKPVVPVKTTFNSPVKNSLRPTTEKHWSTVTSSTPKKQFSTSKYGGYLSSDAHWSTVSSNPKKPLTSIKYGMYGTNDESVWSTNNPFRKNLTTKYGSYSSLGNLFSVSTEVPSTKISSTTSKYEGQSTNNELFLSIASVLQQVTDDNKTTSSLLLNNTNVSDKTLSTLQYKVPTESSQRTSTERIVSMNQFKGTTDMNRFTMSTGYKTETFNRRPSTESDQSTTENYKIYSSTEKKYLHTSRYTTPENQMSSTPYKFAEMNKFTMETSGFLHKVSSESNKYMTLDKTDSSFLDKFKTPVSTNTQKTISTPPDVHKTGSLFSDIQKISSPFSNSHRPFTSSPDIHSSGTPFTNTKNSMADSQKTVFILSTSESYKPVSLVSDNYKTVSPPLDNHKTVSFFSESYKPASLYSVSEKTVSPILNNNTTVPSSSESHNSVSMYLENHKTTFPLLDNYKITTSFTENYKPVSLSSDSHRTTSPIPDNLKTVSSLPDFQKTVSTLSDSRKPTSTFQQKSSTESNRYTFTDNRKVVSTTLFRPSAAMINSTKKPAENKNTTSSTLKTESSNFKLNSSYEYTEPQASYNNILSVITTYKDTSKSTKTYESSTPFSTGYVTVQRQPLTTKPNRNKVTSTTKFTSPKPFETTSIFSSSANRPQESLNETTNEKPFIRISTSPTFSEPITTRFEPLVTWISTSPLEDVPNKVSLFGVYESDKLVTEQYVSSSNDRHSSIVDFFWNSNSSTSPKESTSTSVSFEDNFMDANNLLKHTTKGSFTESLNNSSTGYTKNSLSHGFESSRPFRTSERPEIIESKTEPVYHGISKSSTNYFTSSYSNDKYKTTSKPFTLHMFGYNYSSAETVMQRVPTINPPNKSNSNTGLKASTKPQHSFTDTMKNITQIAVMLNKLNDTTTKNSVKNEFRNKVTSKPIFDTTKPINALLINDCITSFISSSAKENYTGESMTTNHPHIHYSKLPTSDQKENSNIYYYKLPPIIPQDSHIHFYKPTEENFATSDVQYYKPEVVDPNIKSTTEKEYHKITTVNRPVDILQESISAATNILLQTESRVPNKEFGEFEATNMTRSQTTENILFTEEVKLNTKNFTTKNSTEGTTAQSMTGYKTTENLTNVQNSISTASIKIDNTTEFIELTSVDYNPEKHSNDTGGSVTEIGTTDSDESAIVTTTLISPDFRNEYVIDDRNITQEEEEDIKNYHPYPTANRITTTANIKSTSSYTPMYTEVIKLKSTTITAVVKSTERSPVKFSTEKADDKMPQNNINRSTAAIRNTSNTEFVEVKLENKTIVSNKTDAPSTPSSTSAYRNPSNPAHRLSTSTASPGVELHPAPHESMGLEASIAYLGDDIKRFVDLCNELSFKIWTTQTSKNMMTSRSIVLSPFAVLSALAMIFLGARGSSSGIMNDFLKLDDMVTFNPHQVLQNITESSIYPKNIGVANAALVRAVFSDKAKGKVLDFYKERLLQYYDTHVEEINFNSIGDLVRRRTNLLIKRQTQGKIQEYLKGSALILNPPLAILTANVFQTDCSVASTEGRDGEMYFVVRPSTRQRRLVPIPAVVYRGGFLAGYEPGLDATAVTLNPESVVSTILVLPGQQGQVAPGDGLARLEQRLLESSYRRGAWSRLLRSLLFRPGLELQIPRFSHKSVLNLTVGLQKMGMDEIFMPDKADLRGISGVSNELHLSDMVQVNTFSTCGETTVGARHHIETYPSAPQRAGRTNDIFDRSYLDDSVNNYYSSLPLNLRPRQARLPDNPRLRFDRPFLYIVRHNPTGMILYIGRFNPRLLP